MALQTSGPISLLNVQNEFGGSNPIGINEYYGADSGVPTSGTISLNNFYGKTAFQVESYTFTKRSHLVGGKLGDQIIFNAPSGLTNAQRVRSVGLSYYSNEFDPSQLTFMIRGFGANGYMPCFFFPIIYRVSDNSPITISADKADWDPWWRYTRVYQGSTLLYQFDRQNVRTANDAEVSPESQDTNASDGIMGYGQTMFDTSFALGPTMSNVTVTISNA